MKTVYYILNQHNRLSLLDDDLLKYDLYSYDFNYFVRKEYKPFKIEDIEYKVLYKITLYDSSYKNILNNFKKIAQKREINSINFFGYIATKAAYDNGALFVEELKKYLLSNIEFTKNYFENIDKTHTFSLQYNYKPDKKGSNLTINSDYAIDKFNLPFSSLTNYYRSNSLLKIEDITQNTKLSYDIFTTSVDYKKVLNDKNNFSIGLKYSNSSNLNILDSYESNIFVPENSQHFDFFENIYAGYFRYSYKPGKFSYNFGIRNEFTDDKFHTNKNFSGKLNYNNLLPTATISYTINKNNRLYFYLGKEISRPNFFSYDPTIFVSPPNEKSSGNENLKPIKNYKIQSGYTLKQKYSMILQYTYSVDNIVYIPRLTDDNYIFTKPENGGFQNQLLLNLSIPIKFAKFWQSTNKINLVYRDFRLSELKEFYKSYYTTIESNQSFTLPKDISVDVDISYTSPYRNKYNYNYDNFNCGISAAMPIFKEKVNLRLGMSDIFNTNRSKYYSDVNGIYQYNYMKYRTRGFFLKFTFNFKSGKETEDISRDSSAREILRRTGK